MRQIQTDVVVIGGGATGTGVLRDLAMRGLKCILIERRDLAYGTTGRYHGLLHSGGRYVVKDPQAAKECYEENIILRRIMPQCIEDTGGYFVSTPNDSQDYIPTFLEGCKNARIPAEEIPIKQMIKTEPLLNPKIYHCIRVPDASADSFLAAQLNVESARANGAQIFTYHEFKHLLLTVTSVSKERRVTGIVCRDILKDEDIQVTASIVVNAAGAWAGIVLQSAGIGLEMVPGKGTMIAVNHRIVNTVINRCKPPSDGDILVPTHTVAVIGTTDIKVADPDHYAIEPWEIRMMLEEGEKIIPGFKQLRILRAWAGVRPLVHSSDSDNDRDISRSFVLLDHAERDGVEGIITITSGKWTTFRKMAEVTVDKVCEVLKIDKQCKTHLEPLPSGINGVRTFYQAGHRLDVIERDTSYGKLVCECELVTSDEVEKSIIQSNSLTLDDVRRETRLGMGPCQGAFCSFRAVGMLHSLRQSAIGESNDALCDFLEERWKGDLPILSGKQLQQARFNELVYVDVLNAPNLPGERNKKLTAEPYEITEPVSSPATPISLRQETEYSASIPHVSKDVIVIGAGYAGLTAAWQLAKHGKSVDVVSKGWGTPYWSSGCLDILGYEPPAYQKPVANPLEFLEKLTSSNPEHPYSLAGLAAIDTATRSFRELCQQSNYPFEGSVEENIFLPTALGSLRPSCLVPATMSAGNAAIKTPMLIVGFDGYCDFYPGLISENLIAQGLLVKSLSLDLPSLRKRKFLSGMVLARMFDDEEFRQDVIDALKPKLGNIGRIGFPAVLGLNHSINALEHLQSALGAPVFEISGLPPSIPGIRLHNILVSAIEHNHGTIYNGMSVISAALDGDKVQTIKSEAASRRKEHHAKAYILATGGVLGGGSTADIDGYAQESIFNLAMSNNDKDTLRLQKHFLDHAGHPIFKVGVKVDPLLRPISAKDGNACSNLYVVGDSLGNCDPVRERSLEGIALTTGFRAAEIISGEEN